MKNALILIVLLLVLGLAVFYVIKAKKSGRKCIGCPGGCGKDCDGTACNCCQPVQEEE